MALVMTPIYTRVLDNNNTVSVTFNNIPQFYTDLLVRVSARDGSTSGVGNAVLGIQFNQDSDATALRYSITQLNGNGSSATSGRIGANAQYIHVGAIPNTSNTASTFSNTEIYIPNYTSSQFKSFVSDNVSENNAATANMTLGAGLYRSTAAIQSIQLYDFGGAYVFTQHSTFSLYGIIRSGA